MIQPNSLDVYLDSSCSRKAEAMNKNRRGYRHTSLWNKSVKYRRTVLWNKRRANNGSDALMKKFNRDIVQRILSEKCRLTK